MTMETTTTGEVFCPGEDLVIYHVAAQKDRLLTQLASATSGLRLDLSAVSEMDSAGLQLLLLLQREATREGKVFTVENPSAVIRDVLVLCNLDKTFSRQDTGHS